MEKEFLLISFYKCRQFGLFSSIDEAKANALDLYKRSRIKDRYLFWHIVEFDVVSGVSHKVADHYCKIGSFPWSCNSFVC